MDDDRKKGVTQGQYDDIINLPHHVSAVHQQMSLWDRAAQFSPFAALSGYEDAVREAARLTDAWIQPGEADRENMDGKLWILQEHIKEHPEVTVTFFKPDDRKDGGTYESVSGNLRKIDMYERKLVMTDGTTILMEYIIQMECGLFWEDEG